MSEKEDSVLDAPHKPSQRVTRKASKEAKESCSACGIAISTHLGKAGQGTCFGTEVTKVFSDLLTLVGSVKAELEEERHEARDREARLTRKVSELCKMLAAAETRESDALTKLTTVEKTVQTLTKQVQQLQQEAKKGREGESRSSRTEHEGTIGAQCSSPNEAAKSWHEQTDEIVESRTEHGREPSPSSSRPQQGLARPRTDGTGEYKSQERRPRISASTAARPEHKNALGTWTRMQKGIPITPRQLFSRTKTPRRKVRDPTSTLPKCPRCEKSKIRKVVDTKFPGYDHYAIRNVRDAKPPRYNKSHTRKIQLRLHRNRKQRRMRGIQNITVGRFNFL